MSTIETLDREKILGQFYGGDTERVAERLLNGERLTAKVLREEGIKGNPLMTVVHRLQKSGVKVGRAELPKENGDAGRAVVSYWILADGEKSPTPTKPRGGKGKAPAKRTEPKGSKAKTGKPKPSKSPWQKSVVQAVPATQLFGQTFTVSGVLVDDNLLDGEQDVLVYLSGDSGTVVTKLVAFQRRQEA